MCECESVEERVPPQLPAWKVVPLAGLSWEQHFQISPSVTSSLGSLYPLLLASKTTQNKQLAGPAGVGSVREPSSFLGQLANPVMPLLCIPTVPHSHTYWTLKFFKVCLFGRRDSGLCPFSFPCLGGCPIISCFPGWWEGLLTPGGPYRFRNSVSDFRWFPFLGPPQVWTWGSLGIQNPSNRCLLLKGKTNHIPFSWLFNILL